MRVSAGYRTFTGARMTAEQAAAYNAASERVESFERAGLAPPIQLLNGRHNLMIQAAAPQTEESNNANN